MLNKYNFSREWLRLWETPTTGAETYRKLRCLRELEEQHNPNAGFWSFLHQSKRKKRLLKMLRAFRRVERG